jgi:urease accessory protein
MEALTMATTITAMKNTTTMRNDLHRLQPLAFLRLQTWLSPAFPAGSYSYSHGVEWAVEAAYIHDRESLVDWLAADLRYGTGRNEAIFFSESWSSATNDDRKRLLNVAELAAVFRGTAEFALESAQQGQALRSTINKVWRDSLLDWLSDELANRNLPATPAVILGLASARQGIPLAVALPAFLQSYISNLVSAGIRLIPLGQTDGQAAIAALEDVVLAVSSDAATTTTIDLGSAAFLVDLASMAHEIQYTRLFRS